MATSPKIASVVACARLDHSTGDGFVLPLLRTEGQGAWLIQRADESTDRIIAFRTLDGDLDGTTLIPQPVSVRVGQPQIYAFAKGSSIYVGSRNTIEPSLRSFVQDNPQDVATALQVFHIVGTVDERRMIRLRMRSLIQQNMGLAAASSFYTSAIAGIFWIKLFAAWHLASDPGRCEMLRSHFRVSLGDNHRIHIENVEPTNGAEKQSLAQIITELEAEFATQYTQNLANPNLRHRPRQEERIALILLWLLQDHESLRVFLRTYRSHALFEQKSVGLIHKLLGDDLGMSTSENYRITAVSRIVAVLYKLCFPMNRGYFPAFTSRHLGSFGEINYALQHIYHSTYAIFVRRHGKEIEANLGMR
jgi:hypothetical protein